MPKMKRCTGRIPRTLMAKLDDRLMDAGALAVDVAPFDESEPDWAQLTVYLQTNALGAVRTCLRQQLKALPKREREHVMAGFVATDVDESWQTQWAEGLEPVVLVPGLVLVPEGVAYEPRVGERTMVLEKSLVFGFGEHPTTRMIAEWLASRSDGQVVLDVGCGSGVLAFVAAHHAARAVLGIDIDPLSVDAATRNAQRNGWGHVCAFEQTPIEAVGRRFDVVVANVDALTLERLSRSIALTLAANGALALTGVLAEQAQAVIGAFVACDVHLRVSARSDDWVLLTNDG